MQKILLFIAALVFSNTSLSVQAALRQIKPECPQTGQVSCTDGIDNDHDGVIDETAPANAFVATGADYVAEFNAGLLSDQFVSVADNTASGNTYMRIPPNQADHAGQIALCGNFTNDTYFLWIKARVNSMAKNVVWIDTSPIPQPPDNSKGTVLFADVLQPTFGWSINGSSINFITKVDATAQTSIALNGNQCIYVAAQAGVDLDAMYLSPSASAEPNTITGEPPGIVTYEILEVGVAGNIPTIDGTCGENVWNEATAVPFTGFSGAGYNNTAELKLFWDDTTTDVLYGCLDVTVDTDLRSGTK